MQASDSTRQKRRADSKSRTRNVAAGNRYHRRAKASEYTTLKILKGFAEGRTAPELAPGMHVSEKTLRNIYMRLRRKLMPATHLRPLSFGGTGLFLYRSGGLSPTGHAILTSVRNSDLYLRHVRRHAPRLSDPSDEVDHLFEVTVRVFCNIALTKTPEALYAPDTLDDLQSLRDMGTWIAANSAAIVEHWKFSGMPERFGDLASQLEHRAEAEALWSLKTRSRKHLYADTVLYNDLRRFLLTDPL